MVSPVSVSQIRTSPLNAPAATFPGRQEGSCLRVEDHIVDAKPAGVSLVLSGVSGVGREELAGLRIVDLDLNPDGLRAESMSLNRLSKFLMS